MEASESRRGSGGGQLRGRLRFGEFLLDLPGQRLLRSGEDVPLAPKAFQVLSLLVASAGEVLTKERLLDEIWNDVHVMEGVVKVSIAEIRRALGETAARPRHLHTVQRRGYRFEGPVTNDSAASAVGVAPSDLAATARRGAGDAPPGPIPRVAASVGERRQVTLAHCELDALTELRERVAPADLELVLDTCQSAIEAVVRSLGGRVVRPLEEGLVACFGFPASLEDDAGRALRASLRILERMPALTERCAGALSASDVGSLEVRIGVHTGPVDVGPGHDLEALELHDALAEARRVGTQAPPASVWIGDSTRRLVRDSFQLEEQESDASGVRMFRLVRALAATSRLDVADATGLTALAGREQELSLILDRWEVAREGHGQGLLLSGEAGIGKSRLLHQLHQRVDPQEHGWIELRCSAFHRNSSFHPVIETLRHSLLLAPEQTPEEQLAAIEIAIERAALPADESVALIADLLSLPLPTDRPPLQLSPEMHRTRTLAVIGAWLLSLADRRPQILIAEDLHWADPSTIEFLGLLIEQSQTAPLLIVMTHRPDFIPPWSAQPNLAILPLAALTRKQVESMLSDLTNGKRLPRSVREHIVAKSDGVPLFVEELTKSVLESELLEESDEGYERTDPIPALAVPMTLQDSLEARLDRLGPSKELCQLASTLGREFPHTLLQEASELGPEQLDLLLQPILDAGLLYRRGTPPDANYTFKHALIQQTSYQSLLEGTRRDFHGRVARALEADSEKVAREPESLARHYEAAGRTREAIEACERAGRRATAASANVEAIAHFRHALSLVERLPEGAERDRRETSLQVALGLPLVALRGSGTKEVEDAYERARALCLGQEESEQLADALDGLTTFYVTQSRLDDAHDLASQQLELADRLGEPRVRLGGHYSSALIEYFRGDPARALEHFEHVEQIFDPALHGQLISARGENIGAISKVWRSWALWMRGYPDQAIEAGEEGVAVAERVDHAYSLAYALAWVAVVRMNRREGELAIECADASARIGEKHGFPIPLSVARLVRNRWIEDEHGSARQIAAGESALADLATAGTTVAVPQILGGFAEFCLERGHADKAGGYLDAALSVSRTSGQPHWDAELARIAGELELVRPRGSGDSAEQAFRKAVEIAQEQGARMPELRAACRLVALLGGSEAGDAAKVSLARVYAEFSEGFDTQDLRDARELLGR